MRFAPRLITQCLVFPYKIYCVVDGEHIFPDVKHRQITKRVGKLRGNGNALFLTATTEDAIENVSILRNKGSSNQQV